MEWNEDSLTQILQRIEGRLARLEEKYSDLSQKAVSHSFHIDVKHIETLNVQELSCHLDEIHVKELSGMLNIGITSFDKEKEKPHHLKSKQSGPSNRADASKITIRINGKKVPYRRIYSKKDSQMQEREQQRNEKPKLEHMPEHELEQEQGNEEEQAVSSDKEKSLPPDSPEANFTIRDIHIGTIENASAVNFGNSFPAHFKSIKKHNQGFGNITGDENDIHDIRSILEEKDVVDVFHDSENPKQDEWLKPFLKESGKDQHGGDKSGEEDNKDNNR